MILNMVMQMEAVKDLKCTSRRAEAGIDSELDL